MTRPRSNPYLYVTWISKYLVGERSCQWATWLKTNFRHFERVPSTFDSATWNMEHTDMLNECADRLETRGCKVYIESQNAFRVESPSSRLVIQGRPDIIAVDPEGRATIYDVKTGQQADSHVVQVQLYMFLLPRARGGRWRETTFNGALVYKDGVEKLIPASSVDDAFVRRVEEFVRRMLSETAARRVPSAPECRFCEIARADCSERVEWEGE
ncbi:MAG: hypothetical protein F4X34_05755 [Chloroflexi bacterium]|nr:hypothetical protein [Chloroflexota bacterium]